MRVILAALLTAGLAVGQEQENQLDADVRMFTIMAAINIAGYDDGYGSSQDSIVRQAVRTALEDFNGPSRRLITNAYAQFKLSDPSENLSQFVTYALVCEPPPTFELRANLPTDLPPEIRRLRSFAPLFEQFYREANIETLWAKYQPAYNQELDRYQASLVPMLFRTAGYLRLSLQSREFAGFKVWIDLLGAPNSLNTRLYGGNVQVVAHSSERIKLDEIRHSFLVHLLDRLSIRYRDVVAKKEVLSRFALFAPALPESYKTDFELLVTASLVNAIETRLSRGADEEKRAKVEQHMREGYILTPYFFEALPEFEADTRTINKYYTDLIEGIDLKKEAARLQDVKFAERPQRELEQAEPKRVELSEVDKLLQRAEFLLGQEMTEEAREAYLAAQTKAGGGNAQAEYGLARVAITEADPDLAREHFLRAADLASDDPHIRAMSHLYVGRIEDIVGNRDQAVVHYQLALDAGDPSARTREMAQQGIEAPFSRPREQDEEAGEP